jgi:hypothetical protein
MVLEETINRLAKDEDKVKYKQILLRSYIEDSKKVIPWTSPALVLFVGNWLILRVSKSLFYIICMLWIILFMILC